MDSDDSDPVIPLCPSKNHDQMATGALRFGKFALASASAPHLF